MSCCSVLLPFQVVLLLLSLFQLDFLLLSPFKLFILLLPVIIQAHFSVDHHSSSSKSLIIQDLQYTLHIVQTLRSVSHPMQAFRSRLAERKRPKFLPQPLPSTSLLSSSFYFSPHSSSSVYFAHHSSHFFDFAHHSSHFFYFAHHSISFFYSFYHSSSSFYFVRYSSSVFLLLLSIIIQVLPSASPIIQASFSFQFS